MWVVGFAFDWFSWRDGSMGLMAGDGFDGGGL